MIEKEKTNQPPKPNDFLRSALESERELRAWQEINTDLENAINKLLNINRPAA